MIRGTRAAPMLAGLAAVAVAFYLARIGELVTLNWLVSHLLPYVVFALIVVFQSEIRHVLSDVGRRVSFLRGSTVEGDSYDDIVLAANLFSQHQTGALMVIEREIDCERISRVAWRWMRSSLMICWPRFSGQALRCTMARSSSRRIVWRRRLVSCRCR